MILREDAAAIAAVRRRGAELALVVHAAVARLRRGGRIHYFGAGASGRLAVLDATEATPTFGVPAGTILAHFPGGEAAIADSSVDLEDSAEEGTRDAAGVSAADLVIGVSASGGTRYVGGALAAARAVGARTALFTCNPAAALASDADTLVAVDTGAEALAGSTRLKAGTATKAMLNAFSTAVMIGMGRTYSNLMIGMTATNDKLRERAVETLAEASGRPPAECRAMLAECAGDLPLALLRLLSGAGAGTASAALRDARGSVREAGRLLSEHGT
jgi:N-acetylmuramic acid 6-phosphate etherase